MSYVRENDSTQNAHIKHSNDSRQKPTWKNTETTRHMRDSNTCRIMEKGCKTMTNREKFAEQILDIACSGNRLAVNKATIEPIACNSLECRDCLFYTECCKGVRKKWANSEYVEPPVDWSKVAVDTPILATYSGIHRWVKRHFAKYENGRVYAWNHGTTSWSGEMCTVCELAKLPEKEQRWRD